jgi:S1-C subfamily serine protease
MGLALVVFSSLFALAFVLAAPGAPTGARGAEPGPIRPISAADAQRLITATTVRVVGFGNSALHSGSGVACGVDGATITSRHVVEGSAAITVAPHEGPVAFGPVELSPQADVAVVRTQLRTGESLRLADHDPVRGEPVTIAGYPVGGVALEVRPAKVIDYVSGRYRDEHATVMRVSLNPQPGMSGGPVFDARGRLAGIVYASEVQSGYGLVIPASRLRIALNGSGGLTAVGCN